jgi:hypothetical protein
MARSKFVWLVVFENGNTQFFGAQTIDQIISSEKLSENSDDILSITKMSLLSPSDYDYFKNITDIEFRD